MVYFCCTEGNSVASTSKVHWCVLIAAAQKGQKTILVCFVWLNFPPKIPWYMHPCDSKRKKNTNNGLGKKSTVCVKSTLINNVVFARKLTLCGSRALTVSANAFELSIYGWMKEGGGLNGCAVDKYGENDDGIRTFWNCESFWLFEKLLLRDFVSKPNASQHMWV